MLSDERKTFNKEVVDSAQTTPNFYLKGLKTIMDDSTSLENHDAATKTKQVQYLVLFYEINYFNFNSSIINSKLDDVESENGEEIIWTPNRTKSTTDNESLTDTNENSMSHFNHNLNLTV